MARALFAVVATLGILLRILAFLRWPSEAVLVANLIDLATFLAIAVGFAAAIVSWISARFLRHFVAVMLLVVVGFMCPFSVGLNIASCNNRVPSWKLKAKSMDVNPAWRVDYSKRAKIEHWAIEHLDEINQMEESENANRTNQRLR